MKVSSMAAGAALHLRGRKCFVATNHKRRSRLADRPSRTEKLEIWAHALKHVADEQRPAATSVESVSPSLVHRWPAVPLQIDTAQACAPQGCSFSGQASALPKAARRATWAVRRGQLNRRIRGFFPDCLRPSFGLLVFSFFLCQHITPRSPKAGSILVFVWIR